jgi:hypothetical protein
MKPLEFKEDTESCNAVAVQTHNHSTKTKLHRPQQSSQGHYYTQHSQFTYANGTSYAVYHGITSPHSYLRHTHATEKGPRTDERKPVQNRFKKNKELLLHFV